MAQQRERLERARNRALDDERRLNAHQLWRWQEQRRLEAEAATESGEPVSSMSYRGGTVVVGQRPNLSLKPSPPLSPLSPRASAAGTMSTMLPAPSVAPRKVLTREARQPEVDN